MARPVGPAECAARVGADRFAGQRSSAPSTPASGGWLQTICASIRWSPAGTFRGWIVRSFTPDDACLAGVDLRAGDVVTRVNGRGVEHPEEALEVWTKLPRHRSW